MSLLTRFRFFLWYFSRFQVPLIGYLKPKLIQLTHEELVVLVPLNRRSRNHVHSMYFGALAVGADLAGGLYGFYHAREAGYKISLLFKSFQAQFLRRPESNAYFVCTMGAEIQAMLEESQKSKKRINKMINIKAYTNYLNQPEEIADFILELSIKVL